jgi:hypothetical protein
VSARGRNINRACVDLISNSQRPSSSRRLCWALLLLLLRARRE